MVVKAGNPGRDHLKDENEITTRDMHRLETIARKWFSDKPPPFTLVPDEQILRKLIIKATKYETL